MYINLERIELFKDKIILGIKSFLTFLNILIIVIVLFLTYYLLKRILDFILEKRRFKKSGSYIINYHKNEIEKLSKKYHYNEITSKEYLEKLKGKLKDISNFPELVEEKVFLASKILTFEKDNIEWEHNKRIILLNNEKENLEKEVQLKRYYDKEKILRRLDLSKSVYLRDKLNKKEIRALKEKGYIQVNEYCVLNKSVITVLVKPMGNHSITHTFLVWDIKRLLIELKAENIQEKLTVDADLIFEFNKKRYALEIECGSLLSKPNQMREKITYLDKKYPNRWMFIISHRDLLKKYKKNGPTATRSNVREKLIKLLNIAHPD